MSFDIYRQEGQILVSGNVRVAGLRRLCSCIYQAVEECHFKNVVLDFTFCDGITEAVMLPLMPIITKYREKFNVEFILHEPRNENLERLFTNANWAHHITPEDHAPRQYEGGHVSAKRFIDAEQGYGILEKIMKLIMTTLEIDRNTLKAVEWSLGEIIDNVPNHAESPVGGFVQATAYSTYNRVEFVVADAGIGIPASMKEHDHVLALQNAISEGVTRDKNNNAGNGLFGSYQVATISGGEFEINSRNASLYYRNELKTRHNRIPYPGTSVRCSIGLDNPMLLDEALRFEGKPYDPAYDYIERKFENEAGDLIFNMKEQAERDFSSRQGGRRARQAIENLLREGHVVILDFSGVGVVSSSFADEVFGRLFVEMGPRAFMTRIAMRNVDRTVEGLIDRAIVQRTRLGNGGAHAPPDLP